MIENINKDLKNTRISKVDRKLKIELLKEGWVTELFIIIQILKKDKDLEIKGVFQVYREDKMIIKEALELREKLVKYDYINFVDLVKNGTKTNQIGSGRIEWNRINEIEIRLNKNLKDKKDLGFNEVYINLLKEIIPIEIS